MWRWEAGGGPIKERSHASVTCSKVQSSCSEPARVQSDNSNEMEFIKHDDRETQPRPGSIGSWFHYSGKARNKRSRAHLSLFHWLDWSADSTEGKTHLFVHDCTSWWWFYVWLPVLQLFICWLLISTVHGSIVQPEVMHLHLIHIFTVFRIFLHIFLSPCRCWKVRGCLITHEGRRRGKHSCCKAFWSFWLPACSCHSVWLKLLVDYIFKIFKWVSDSGFFT